MKIISVKAIYPDYQHVPPSWRTHLWQIFVQVETDTGEEGFGYGGGGKASVEIINTHFRELLVGQKLDTKDDISRIWDLLYENSIPYGRKGVAIMALSGVDLALWDTLGKAEAIPVHRLIGDQRKQVVECYATGTDVEWYAELGFKSHKFPHRWTGEGSYEKALESANRSRQVLGKEALIMIDTYMSWDFDVTLKMSEILNPYDIYWFEDVLTPDELDGQQRLRPQVKPTLISGGEHEFTHYGFSEIAKSKALDLWQPDITWCGGITAGLRIMKIADSLNIPVVPHRGGEVWGLHLIVASNCLDMAEILPGTREGSIDKIWIGEPQHTDGSIMPTEKPGFGISVNPEFIS